MVSTFTEYADFVKALRAGFQTVSPTVYYFDDTAGPTATFYIWAIYWAGGDGLQIAVPTTKPATFTKDFVSPVQLMSFMALS